MPGTGAPPPPPPGRRRSARDAVLCVLVVGLLLALIEGPSLRSSGEEMQAGVTRTAVLAVGRPAGWLGDRLPLADAEARLSSWLSPQDDGDGEVAASAGGPADAAVVTPDAFAPGVLAAPSRPRALRTLLVTGDSMSQPLDTVLARRLAGRGVRVTRDAHLGTGISKTALLDWGAEARRQARAGASATVVLLGANEGFPMAVGGRGTPVGCCGAAWAAEYATRARRMMDAYRRGGAGIVYWLTLPLPRDPARARIARTVNAAVRIAAEPYRAQVRMVELADLFTPGGRYRDAMPVGGRDRLVRAPDGIHLNQAGSEIAADALQAAMRPDFAER